MRGPGAPIHHIVPAMTLAEALDMTRSHSIAGRTGDRTTFVTMHPLRVLHHKVVEVGLRGNEQIPMSERCRRQSEEAWRQRLAAMVNHRLST